MPTPPLSPSKTLYKYTCSYLVFVIFRAPMCICDYFLTGFHSFPCLCLYMCVCVYIYIHMCMCVCVQGPSENPGKSTTDLPKIDFERRKSMFFEFVEKYTENAQTSPVPFENLVKIYMFLLSFRNFPCPYVHMRLFSLRFS